MIEPCAWHALIFLHHGQGCGDVLDDGCLLGGINFCAARHSSDFVFPATRGARVEHLQIVALRTACGVQTVPLNKHGLGCRRL